MFPAGRWLFLHGSPSVLTSTGLQQPGGWFSAFLLSLPVVAREWLAHHFKLPLQSLSRTGRRPEGGKFSVLSYHPFLV